MRNPFRLLLIGTFTAGAAMALPPPPLEFAEVTSLGEPVTSIPAASSIEVFQALDNEHVMVSLASKQQYLVTLNRQCVGLRWARHIGVTTSGNTIWAGFDNVTADGRNCQIREIHRLPDSLESALP